jgi:NADPH-dependent 2,4-dienoyl-CoA reductase/sulfur reductase-like enzyme
MIVKGWRWAEANCSSIPAEEKDLVIIGGGVAGYVAAIKAGQEGLKVKFHLPATRINRSLSSHIDGLY